MIEKFNFYDVYGYFLPGAALLGVLWMPFGIVLKVRPQEGWSSAVLALALAAFAYVLGHFLQTYGATALESKVANGRFPSDAILDPGQLPDALRSKIAEIMLSRFGLDLSTAQAGSKEIDKVRNYAFFIARSTLVKSGSGSYAEQYQGMYALTRGLTVAFGWATTYWLGWSGSHLRGHGTTVTAVILLTIVALSLISVTIWITLAGSWHIGQKISLIFLAPANFLVLGYLEGASVGVSVTDSVILAVAAAAAFLATLRFYGAYRAFADHFAKAVWRDFLALMAFQPQTANGH